MKYLSSHIYPLGIRWQLMFWYSFVFALLMVFAGLLVYNRLQSTLAGSLDTELQLQAQQIAGDITIDDGQGITVHDATADLPGFGRAGRGQHSPPPADVNLDILVRVLDKNGQPLRTTPAFYALIVPPQSVTQPLHGLPWQGTITTVDGQAVRLYSRALVSDNEIFGVVQVGTTLTQVDTTLQDVSVELLLLAPFMLALGGLISYWLTARAFMPIERLIKAARKIRAGDLRQRVPVPRPHDEVRDLALTLNEMIEHLEQAFARQQRFVADASHELRTPVAVIRNKADMALMQIFTPDEHLNVFRSIYSETERLGHLIANLLALAHLDEGQVRQKKEVVRLDHLAQVVAEMTEPLATEHQVNIQVETKGQVRVSGDEARLLEVVMNLTENAILYNNAEGTVSLSVKSKDALALLIVRDTGIGIAPEHIPHLVERFYRVDPARTYTSGGNSGLGLAIVDGIVRAQGGSLTIESQIGQGSTFTVALPLSQ
jgi:two-component system OmpR family sensor kinase